MPWGFFKCVVLRITDSMAAPVSLKYVMRWMR
jgi:hypothetical protein